MKNLNKFLMLLTSAVLLVTSCQKPTDETINAKLALSGGTTLVVDGKDAEGTVTVTATAAVSNDVIVSLVVTPATGEAVLEKQEVVIAKGATSASTKVTFPLAKFPKGTDQMKITINGSSTTPGVELVTPSTDFFVSGGGKDLPFELTISAKSTTINTDEKNGVAELSFILTKLATEDLTISYTYDDGKTLADADFKWNPETIVIPKDGMTKSATITVPKGKEGKLPIKFSIANKDITLKTEKIELVFQVPPFPDAPVSLCLTEIKYRNYVITKTFTIGDYTLSPEHDLSGAYGLEDKTKTVTANVNNGSLLYLQAQNKDNSNGSDKYSYAMWVDWNRNGKLSESELIFKEAWAAGPVGGVIAPYVGEITIPEGTVEGKYYARIGAYFMAGASLTGGCGSIETSDFIDVCLNYQANLPLTAVLSAEGTTDFTVVGKMKKIVTVKLSRKHDAPVTVNLAASVTGGTGSATLSASSITIAAGAISGSTELVFDDANFAMGGQPTFIDVKATAADASVTISANANKVSYTARCLGASGTLTSYCKIGNTGYSYATIGGGSVGGITLRAGNPTLYNEYIDLSQDPSRAKIKAGTEVKLSFLNVGAQGFCMGGDTFEAVVYIDWNKDGDFADSGEKVARTQFSVEVAEGAKQELSLTIATIPADAQKISTMRILTHFLGTPTSDGCQAIESGNVYDVAYILD